ncbi:MAG TPA: T9SS type A sorting domain-containing protein, partial [Saprospiraceae bacterium]|nr:T9SS type A sorting domain-containing protein [Saprospiraceae bacterium]
HPDHEGAWPADVYYADMNGTWTDNSVNVTVANDERHHNTPGDGNFDQSLLPTEVELQIGRVDFAKMPAFATSEQELLRNYLDKDHAYRHKQFSATRRGVVDDNFGFFGTEAFAASGYKNFGPLVGPENVKSDDYFATTADSSYLWAYGCGGGWYQGAGGIGSTGDFANSNTQSVFSMLFGSYFGDWDSQDNFLRAPLAQGTTLTNAWSGRPHWLLHHMGLGENIGYSTRLTQNNNSLYFYSYGARFVHIALMGDPTLRNDVIAPASNVVVTNVGPYHQLTWSPSPDPVLGYHVYVKAEDDDEFVLLNETPHPDIAYTHDCVADTGLLTYMVRAVALQQSPSGTYYNLSQGVTDTITGAGIPEVDAQASWEIISDDVAFTNLSINASVFTWSFGDGEMSSEANPTHNYQDGFFNGSLIASNGCDADTFYFDVLIFTGIKDITEDPSISISPNPTSGSFKLSWTDLSADAIGVKIYSLSGRQVYGRDAINNGTEIDLSVLPAGMYVMHILKGGVRSMKRVVLQ